MTFQMSIVDIFFSRYLKSMIVKTLRLRAFEAMNYIGYEIYLNFKQIT